jgi:hypothetical protein
MIADWGRRAEDGRSATAPIGGSSVRQPSHHGVHGKHCDVLFVHRLKVHGVNGQHLDGAPAAGPDHKRLMSLWGCAVIRKLKLSECGGSVPLGEAAARDRCSYVGL